MDLLMSQYSWTIDQFLDLTYDQVFLLLGSMRRRMSEEFKDNLLFAGFDISKLPKEGDRLEEAPEKAKDVLAGIFAEKQKSKESIK